MIKSVLISRTSLLGSVHDLGKSEAKIIDEPAVGGKAAGVTKKSSKMELTCMWTRLLLVSPLRYAAEDSFT